MNELSALGVVIDRQRYAKAAEEARALGQRWNNKPIGVREVSRRTADHTGGEPVHYNTIGRYQRGSREQPRSDTLAALARVLATEDCPFEQLFAEFRVAAGIPVGPGVGWNPPIEALEMNVRQRQIIEDTIREFARANRTVPPSGNPPTTSPEGSQ